MLTHGFSQLPRAHQRDSALPPNRLAGMENPASRAARGLLHEQVTV